MNGARYTQFTIFVKKLFIFFDTEETIVIRPRPAVLSDLIVIT